MSPAGRPTTAIVARRHSIAVARAGGAVKRRKTVPEYLEHWQVDALLKVAPNPDTRLTILIQWRAGLRISEALAIERSDVLIDSDHPVIRVRAGKGGKGRLVPAHPELRSALRAVLDYRESDRLVTAHRTTALRRMKQAYARAVEAGLLPSGMVVGTHTLRHSYARHCLLNGIQINYLSKWLGHATITPTLIYLELLPDPFASVEAIP